MAKTMSFDDAVSLANTNMRDTTISLDVKLMLYGYYKVATLGARSPTSRTVSMTDKVKHAKWDECAAKYTPDDAKKRYVALVYLLSQQAKAASSQSLSKK